MVGHELELLERRGDRRFAHLSTVIAAGRPVFVPHGPLAIAICAHAVNHYREVGTMPHKDRGASLVEYALIVALVAIVSIGALLAFQSVVGEAYMNHCKPDSPPGRCDLK